MIRDREIYFADFETNNKTCEVVCWCLLKNEKEIYTGQTIDDFMINCCMLQGVTNIYFHNLSFDGDFIRK
jgi:hypothetical protein